MITISRVVHAVAIAFIVMIAGCAEQSVAPNGAPSNGNIFLTQILDPLSQTPIVRGLVLTPEGTIVRQFDSIIFEVRPRGGIMVYRDIRDMARWASRTDGSSPHMLRKDSLLTLGQFAVLSPDGSLLAYVDRDDADSTTGSPRNGFLVVERTDGGGAQVIASGVASGSNVSFSHDGMRIAFLGNDHELHSVPVTGGQSKALGLLTYKYITVSSVDGVTPEWSPDGASIVVATYTFGLGLYPSDGSMAGREPDKAAFDNFYQAAWSPDGKLIATTHDRDVLLFDSNLKVVRMFDDVGTNAADMLQWSRDSRSLLFVEFDLSFTGPVRIIDVATGTVRVLADRSFYAFWEL